VVAKIVSGLVLAVLAYAPIVILALATASSRWRGQVLRFSARVARRHDSRSARWGS
jgi:hypothetical protein